MGWMVNDYPEPPPEKPLPYCAWCMDGLTEEFYITDNGEEICEDCLEEFKKDMSLSEFAELLGYDKRYLE